MKLAELLLNRSELQQKMENIKNRLSNNIKVQENSEPHENPTELMREFTKTNSELASIVKQINQLNNTTILPDGRTLSEALVDREKIMKERQMLSSVVKRANEQDYRLTHAEIKMCVTVNITDIQKRIDVLSKEFRMLDTTIQSYNWTVDV